MADILTLVFRTFMSRTSEKKEVPLILPSSENCIALMVGNHQVGHSLLLLSAITATSELGIRVAFYTQAQIQSLPVSVQKCVPTPSPDSLKRITFFYPRNLHELLKQIASLHESPRLPSLIIIDKLEGFLCVPSESSYCAFRKIQRASAGRFAALLCDTAAFITQTLKREPGSAPCRVLASFFSGVDTDHASRNFPAKHPILDVLDRYFLVRCNLDDNTGFEAQAATADDMWHICLSQQRITEAASAGNSENKLSLIQEWKLFVLPDGLMEFRLV